MNRRNVIIGGLVGAVALTIAISGSRGGLRAVEHDSSLSGTGSSGSPLALASVATLDSGVFSGTGSAGSPLSVNLSESVGAMFGDGSDGTCAFDGSTVVLGITPAGFTSTNPNISGGFSYTLVRDIFCDDATLSSNIYVITNGWRVFVRGTLTLNSNSYLGRVGNNGNGSAAGAGGSVGTVFLGVHAPGGAGGALDCVGSCANGGAANPFHPECGTAAATGASAAGGDAQDGGACQGGGGGSVSIAAGSCVGASSVGCNGGSATLASVTSSPYPRSPFVSIMNTAGERGGQAQRLLCGTGGGGGRGSTSGRGGGGGSGGGCVVVIAHEIVGSGTITARGGNGAVGSGAGAHGGGGGGGGGGGNLAVVIGKGSFPTTDVSGGTGGAPGVGSSSTGRNAGNGGTGILQLIRVGYN